jgi:hypothetical protein
MRELGCRASARNSARVRAGKFLLTTMMIGIAAISAMPTKARSLS